MSRLPRRCALRALTLWVFAVGCGSPATSQRARATPPTNAVAVSVREAALPITGTPADYDSLMALIGHARFVLLGEATHGTHEFYRERARITQRLIQEKGFTAIAVEGDWPDTYRVNQYVRGISGTSAEQALAGYTRFPTWMWRNADVRDLVRWLRAYNDARPTAADAADVLIDAVGVRPIPFDGDPRETLLLDEPLRDARPLAVELVRAVCRLAEQDDSRVTDQCHE